MSRKSFEALVEEVSVPDGVTPPDNLGPTVELNTITPMDKHRGYGELVKDAETRLPASMFGNAKQLPDLDASFVLADKHTAKVIEMSDVEAAITGEGTMSQESAVLADTVFGEFLTNHRTKAHFTQKPTSVGFEDAQKFMAKRISQEAAQAFSSVEKSFLDNVLKVVDGARSQSYTDTVASLKKESQDLCQKLNEARNPDGTFSFGFKGYFRDKDYVKVADTPIAKESFEGAIATNPNSTDKLTLLQNVVCGLAQYSTQQKIPGLTYDTVETFLNSYASGAVHKYLDSILESKIPDLSIKAETLKECLARPACDPKDILVQIKQLHELATVVAAAPIDTLVANRLVDSLLDVVLGE